MTESIEAFFAQRYPHVAPIADEVERILTMFAATNSGYGELTIKAAGFECDDHSTLVIPDFRTTMTVKRNKPTVQKPLRSIHTNNKNKLAS